MSSDHLDVPGGNQEATAAEESQPFEDSKASSAQSKKQQVALAAEGSNIKQAAEETLADPKKGDKKEVIPASANEAFEDSKVSSAQPKKQQVALAAEDPNIKQAAEETLADLKKGDKKEVIPASANEGLEQTRKERTKECCVNSTCQEPKDFANDTVEIAVMAMDKTGVSIVESELEQNAVASDREDGILESIQPLPEQGRPTQTDSAIPGAHAVAGPGLVRSASSASLQELAPASTRNDNSNFSSTTTLDAFLYEPREFCQADTGDIEDQSDVELAEAIPMSSTRKAKDDNDGGRKVRRKRFLIPLVAVVLLFGMVLAIVFVFLGRNKQEDRESTSSDQSNSSGPTGPVTYPPFRDDLNAATLKAIQESPSTPESRANDWMWNDPNLDFYSKQRQERRFGLVALYYATQGDQWFQNHHWLEYDVSECQWFSKTTTNQPACDEGTDAMAVLDLRSNNLNGTLPKNFWNIKPKYLDISRNLLAGTMPPFPANILWIEHFIVSHNQFEGPLVGESGFEPTNLLTAAFDDNKFVGDSENGGALYPYIHNIQILNFTVNLIQGTISPNLQHLTDLRYLGGGHNRLEGGMASEIGMLTKLKDFDYSGNPMLTGTIPTELNLLTNLLIFDITETGLTGAIPEAFCDQADQELLQVEANCSHNTYLHTGTVDVNVTSPLH